MLPYFGDHYGNASSKTHSFGWMAEAATDMAREQVATCIGANTNEIVFCSGATEANNMALQGMCHGMPSAKPHLLVGATEHLSVLDCAKELGLQDRAEVTLIPVQSSGIIRPQELKALLQEDTHMVSIMLVNNEIGTIQDVAGLSRIIREIAPNAVIHCDAAQALGKIKIDVAKLGVDLLSLSSHKVYGPKGVGALWMRRRPKLSLRPLLFGGGQEGGLRAGTLPVPLLIGFGAACELAEKEQTTDEVRISDLRDSFLSQLTARISDIRVNGCQQKRIGGNLNLRFQGVLADSLLIELNTLACSTGSACSSMNAKTSHVLKAIGSQHSKEAVRFGLGRFTTEAEIEEAVRKLVSAVDKLRSLRR